MSSESVAAKHDVETDASAAASKEGQIVELNNRLKTDFMAHCFSFLHEDEEARQCIQIVWNRYLECVGDVAMLAAFFDTLPYHLKVSVLPRYQQEIIQWCEKTFHVRSQALLCSTYYSETFQRVIRYALTNVQYKKAIIYIPTDFDPNLRIDLAASISNIRFEQIPNKTKLEDLIDVERLEELIRRDASDTLSYPFMVIANAGSPLLGRCDDLKKIKALCEQYDIWLHVIGDLLGSLPLVSSLNDDVNISCDSLTMDIMKLFGIQNLPYLTFFLRSTGDGHTAAAENSPVVKSHPLDEFILHSPSISFLSVWSISQRCSKESILHHMKQSFEMVSLLLTRLRQIKAIRILNDEDDGETNKYERICLGSAPNEPLPKSIVIFRFQAEETTDEAASVDNLTGYVDLLNLWLFDKLAQQHPKVNLELLKSVHFQQPRLTTAGLATPAHALRFAPLEHLLDVVESDDIQSFADDAQRFSDILFATLSARASLIERVSAHENLAAVPLSNWAGIGAIRYIPSTVDRSNMNATSAYEINTIQAELARQLQTNDSAFSLGGGTEEDSMLYLRLGMIRKREDLDVLLNKISQMGKDTETSLKYIEDMAQKIKMGIEKAQKDLEDENLQLLAQEGLLRQLPLVSNIMSWWSPAPSTLPLAMKGRSFDLNSGQVESTEETYVHRMQIKKQPLQAAMHETSAAPTDEPPSHD